MVILSPKMWVKSESHTPRRKSRNNSPQKESISPGFTLLWFLGSNFCLGVKFGVYFLSEYNFYSSYVCRDERFLTVQLPITFWACIMRSRSSSSLEQYSAFNDAINGSLNDTATMPGAYVRRMKARPSITGGVPMRRKSGPGRWLRLRLCLTGASRHRRGVGPLRTLRCVAPPSAVGLRGYVKNSSTGKLLSGLDRHRSASRRPVKIFKKSERFQGAVVAERAFLRHGLMSHGRLMFCMIEWKVNMLII